MARLRHQWMRKFSFISHSDLNDNIINDKAFHVHINPSFRHDKALVIAVDTLHCTFDKEFALNPWICNPYLFLILIISKRQFHERRQIIKSCFTCLTIPRSKMTLIIAMDSTYLLTRETKGNDHEL